MMDLVALRADALNRDLYLSIGLAYPDVFCIHCVVAFNSFGELPMACPHCGANRSPETMRGYSDVLIYDLVRRFATDLESLADFCLKHPNDSTAIRGEVLTLRTNWLVGIDKP